MVEPANQEAESLLSTAVATGKLKNGDCGYLTLFKKRFVVGVPHISGIVCASLMIGVALSSLFGGGSHITKGKEFFQGSKHGNDAPSNGRGHQSDLSSTSVNNIDIETKIETSMNGLRVAWLMSFPNSGTSFTSKLVRHSTRTHTATNYGEENIDETKGESVPVFSNHTEGPFWTDPLSHPEYEEPLDFVLTKTHCGGRCEKCGPSKYVENPHLFLKDCLSGKRGYRVGKGNTVFEDVFYNPDLVARAVHLIRNPFDNVVSEAFEVCAHSMKLILSTVLCCVRICNDHFFAVSRVLVKGFFTSHSHQYNQHCCHHSVVPSCFFFSLL